MTQAARRETDIGTETSARRSAVPRHRRIAGLEQASLATAPRFPKEGARSAVQRQGLRYQHAVVKALGGTSPGQWFQFRDANGPGHCQPDLLTYHRGVIWVIEVKLTYTPEADTQLAQLYLPVVAMALGAPTRGLIVCRNLTPQVPASRRVSDMADALLRPPELGLSVLQWLGKGQFPHTLSEGRRVSEGPLPEGPSNWRLPL